MPLTNIPFLGTDLTHWIVLILFIVLTALFNVKTDKHEVPQFETAMKRTLRSNGMAALFGVCYIWPNFGWQYAQLYAIGYVIEYSLSFDNMFVIGNVIKAFKVEPSEQRKLLNMGILGAAVLRAVAIGLGAAYIEDFWWLLPLFGMLLIYSAYKMIFGVPDNRVEIIIRWAKLIGISAYWACWISVESTDMLFALDSIPTIFSITNVGFIVFSASMIAVMSLRDLFFVVEAMKAKFYYLEKVIPWLLVAIGIKIVLPAVHHIVPAIPELELSNGWSIAITMGFLGYGLAYSLLIKNPEEDKVEAEEEAFVEGMAADEAAEEQKA